MPRKWQAALAAIGFATGLIVVNASTISTWPYFVGLALVILSVGGFKFWLQDAIRARRARRNEHRKDSWR